MRKKFNAASLNRIILIFLALVLLHAALAAETGKEEDPALRIRQAIKDKKYDLAIELSREQLARQPENYEFNFLLAQALAFSGRWDEASEVLRKLERLYPGNADVLLFLARVESWKQNYQSAEELFRQVLESRPGNLEARLGLGDLAAWQGDYSRAIDIYQEALTASEEAGSSERAEILFRIGRTYLWGGNYRKAQKFLARAVRINPENREYRLLLERARPGLRENFEVRYEQQVESFSDERSDYLDSRLAFQFPLSDLGPMVVKAVRTRRSGENDYQLEAEFYPRLWTGAYAFINGSYGLEAVHFPRYGALLEIYQTLPGSWEVSAGLRRMSFTQDRVWIYLGSIGHYFGSYLAYFRWYYSPGGEGSDFSWTLNIRRYFSRYSYLYAGYGQGSRPFDPSTEEDYRVSSTRIFTTGVDWICWRHFRLQLNFTHRKEPLLKRNQVLLSFGYVW